MFVILLLVVSFPFTEAMSVLNPELCLLLDGFLSVYGLLITGLLINEKFFKTKSRSKVDTEVKRCGDDGGYEALTRDPESGRNQRAMDDPNYTALKRRTDGEYKELPVRRERQKNNGGLYQDLRSATRDTYDHLQMQPLPAR